MAFNDIEVSTQAGRPAALYRMDWGATSWFYTSADREIKRQELVNGEMVEVTYEPKAMNDNGMVQGRSTENDFQVDGPSDLPIVRLFRGSPPSETIWLTVRRKHVGDDDAPIHWKGTVWNLKRPTDAKVSILGRPLSASLRQTGLRLCWTRECPHFLYDSECKVDPADFRVHGTVVEISGTAITIDIDAAQDPGYFRGGFVEWAASDDGTLERRFVEDDAMVSFQSDPANPATEILALRLRVFGLVDFVAVGDDAWVYPGCSRTSAVCESKFNNLANYGGFEDMPGESPFVSAIW